MHLSPYKSGFRRNSAGRLVLIVEYLLPEDLTMTELGKLAATAQQTIVSQQATIHSQATEITSLQQQLAAVPPQPVVGGDADDKTALDGLAAAVSSAAPK